MKSRTFIYTPSTLTGAMAAPLPVFVTGNKDKAAELLAATSYCGHFEVAYHHIEELQGSAVDIARHKAKQAFVLVNTPAKRPWWQISVGYGETRPVFVEDTSLELEALGGMPGPYIKSFQDAMSCEEIARLVAGTSNTNATARSFVCHVCRPSAGDALVEACFEAHINGTIVAPRGSGGFGFDSIFQPLGAKKTLAEMEPSERSEYVPRILAVKGLFEHLALERG